MTRARRLAAVTATSLVLLAAATATAVAAPASLPDIEDEVMCPVCGTTLQLANGPQAQRERNFILDQIERNRSKAEIKQDLVAEYGPTVLAVPPKSGFDLSAWLVPGAVILGALLLVLLILRRWLRGGKQEGPPPALSSDEAERLNADMAHYDV